MTLVQSTRARHGKEEQRRHDITLWVLGVAAAILSVIAFVVTFKQGHVLAYNDAISHQMIARRVLVNIDGASAAQLGSVWPPLTHVLMLPLIVFDSLYYSGTAGAIISMLCFVLSVVFTYKILLRLTGSKVAGVTAAVVFAVNANILYMQSTPMTELPLYAALLAAVYFLQVWADDRKYTYMVAGGFALFTATLIRYESWPILFVFTLVVLVTAWRERIHGVAGKQRVGRTSDLMLPFGIMAYAGIIFWLIWNQVLFGDAMAFQGGEYAKPALWLTNNEPAIGNWTLSFKTFYYATIENVPWPLLIAAVVGLYAFVAIEMVKGRFHARSLMVPSLLIVIPFFIIAFYTGQRPLHVEQINGSLYNTRFGLIMALPVALFAGYLIGVFRKFGLVKIVVAALVIGLASFTTINDLRTNSVITLNDPVSALKQDRAVWSQQAVDTFGPLYDGGLVLVETFGNERFTFDTVPSDKMIYEGINKDGRWKKALVNPASYDIEWIVMRCVEGYEDKVCTALVDNTAALDDYVLVATTPVGYKFYQKKR